MEQNVVIKLGDFDVQKQLEYFVQTVNANGDIWEDQGWLRSALPMLESYYSWQSEYYPLLGYCRDVPSGQPKSYDPTKASASFKNLQASIDACFNSPEFVNSWQEVEKRLDKNAQVRFIFETDNLELQKLPLQACKLFNSHEISGIVWHNFRRERVSKLREVAHPNRVRILTVFGDNAGLSQIKTDWDILQNRLTNAELIPLVKPSSQQLQDFLYRENIDVILFTGHGPNRQDFEQDWIPINSHERLKIDDLQDALKNSIEKQGLRLVICNFCNGLSIANKLWEMGVPEVIAMREPVLDSAARNFLDYFLDGLTNNPEQPLYFAVRQAKQRLGSEMQDYPGAAFLPVIFQDPEELSLTGEIAFSIQVSEILYGYEGNDSLFGEDIEYLLSHDSYKVWSEDSVLWGGNKRRSNNEILAGDENDELLVGKITKEEDLFGTENEQMLFVNEGNNSSTAQGNSGDLDSELMNNQVLGRLNKIDSFSLGDEWNDSKLGLELSRDNRSIFPDI